MAIVKQRTRMQVWCDVIFAIFIREIKSKFNDKFGISWSILNPVLFILVLSLIRGRLDGGETHSMPTFMFMVYGMVLIQFFMGTVESVSGAIKKNKPLYAFRQVQPIASVIAIGVFDLIVKIFVIALLFLVTYLIGIEIRIDDALFVLFNLFLVWIFSISVGMLFAIGRAFVPEVDKIKSLLMRPMFFISGVFFSLQDIPREYWPYLDWNPLLHAIELSRDAAYSSFGAIGVSQQYVVECTFVAVFFALACYRLTWKTVLSK